MKLNFLIIPIIVFLFAFIGSLITSKGMKWYKKIKIPKWTPKGSVIGFVWTIIFILTCISVLIVWNTLNHNFGFWIVLILFILNGFFNVFWSYLFFGKHFIKAAIFEAALLGLSVLGLIILILPLSLVSSMLLVPYFCWVCFATYLTAVIYRLNA